MTGIIFALVYVAIGMIIGLVASFDHYSIGTIEVDDTDNIIFTIEKIPSHDINKYKYAIFKVEPDRNYCNVYNDTDDMISQEVDYEWNEQRAVKHSHQEN